MTHYYNMRCGQSTQVVVDSHQRYIERMADRSYVAESIRLAAQRVLMAKYEELGSDQAVSDWLGEGAPTQQALNVARRKGRVGPMLLESILARLDLTREALVKSYAPAPVKALSLTEPVAGAKHIHGYVDELDASDPDFAAGARAFLQLRSDESALAALDHFVALRERPKCTRFEWVTLLAREADLRAANAVLAPDRPNASAPRPKPASTSPSAADRRPVRRAKQHPKSR